MSPTYFAVPTVASGDMWTAGNQNTYVRDNFGAGVPDIFTAKGDLAVATAADVAAALAVGANGLFLKADSGESAGMLWGSVTLGVQTVYVPATAIAPATTGGCGLLNQTEVSSQQPEVIGLPFDGSTPEYGIFSIPFPKKWNEGTLTYIAYWASSNTGTEGVVWGLSAVALADGDPFATAFGTEVQVTDNGQSAAWDQLISAVSGAMTVDGSPAEGEKLHFQVSRDPADGSDTMSEDAVLIGIKILYTTDAENDD